MEVGTPSYLCYRCLNCNRLITRLEIQKQWRKRVSNLCPCGAGKVSPANPTIWEELTKPRIWRLWWSEVLWK